MINIITKRAKPQSIKGTKQSKKKDGETKTYHPTIKGYKHWRIHKSNLTIEYCPSKIKPAQEVRDIMKDYFSLLGEKMSL